MQGGDLIKWDKAKVGYYVGVDIAEGSVSFPSHDKSILYAYTNIYNLMQFVLRELGFSISVMLWHLCLSVAFLYRVDLYIATVSQILFCNLYCNRLSI